ncbi:MAG: arylsulfatase [Planctomycetia bacterium]|jgi:arylsulfatase
MLLSLRSLGAIAVLLLVTAAFADKNTPSEKPNVILVMTDDQGYGDLSCHGNPILKTPNLDKLQTESVRLTDFHVAPMCTPTRGQLMTGRDAMNNGATFVNRRTMIREELPTVANIFKDNGYRTGLFGKWHLGDSYPHRPIDRGFDTVIGHPSWGITSIADHFGNDYFDDTYSHNGKKEKYKGYCTDVWFAEAKKWIKACQEKDEPFFCYIPTNVPHGPHWVNEKYSKLFKGKKCPANFFGMITNLDENVGKLQEFLKKNGLMENTIFVYLTDNGTVAGEKVFNAGMRGKKCSYYDGGHRVPCYVRWPNGKLGDPRDIDTLTQVQDILPTLIDFCHLKTPEGTDFNGTSLVPLLRGQVKPDAKKFTDRMVVIQYGAKPKKFQSTVLWNKWRLVKGKELYQVDKDPGQKNDVAADHPEIVKKMREHYEQWWAKNEPLAKQKKWIVLGAKEENPTMLYASDWQGDYADNWWNIAPGKANGKWNVRVKRPGQYALTLYRWWPEAKTPLDAPLVHPSPYAKKAKWKKGKAIPIRMAHLKIGWIDEKKKTVKGADSATFFVSLGPGEQTLTAEFLDEDGKPLCGAYFVKIELLDR